VGKVVKMANYNKLETMPPIAEPGNILANLLREIICDLDYIPLMNDLVELRLNELNDGRMAKTKLTKGPIDAEILSDTITFNSLTDKLFNVLRLDDVTFSITVNKDGKRKTFDVTPKIMRTALDTERLRKLENKRKRSGKKKTKKKT
jgi:hypothetical protein